MNRLPVCAFVWCVSFVGFALICLGRSAHAQNADRAVVYGRLNIAIEQVDLSSPAKAQTSRLSNNRSVLGFRGAEDVGDGLKVVWQLEGALSPDNGGGGFTSRDTRLGLTGAWGTLFVGVWTLPYTLSTSSFDPFYPTTAGYMALMGNGSAPSSDNLINTSAFDRRQRNVVQYWSPVVSGLSARLAYALNEETVAATGAKPSLISAAASAELGNLTLTLAHEIHRHYQTATGSDRGSKFGMAYVCAAWRLAGAFEHLHYDTSTGSLSRSAAYLAASRKLSDVTTLNAGFAKAYAGHGSATGRVGALVAGAGSGATQFTLGVDYALSRRTSLFAYASRIANQSAATYDFAINQAGVVAGQSPHMLALGLRSSF